ncbi:MAG: hypothetical protein L3J71_03775 [Victivallaceae bacterium]|nr:hypothetical protein [Victivallaceae bacterium]
MTGLQFDMLIGVICVMVLINLVMLIVFILEAGKIGRMFDELEKFKVANNAEMNSMVWHEKKLEGEVSEIILELRRTNKLLYEMRGAGVTDFIQEYHDSDVFRQDRADKFKTHMHDIKEEAIKDNAENNTPRGIPDIDALKKTPVISRKNKIIKRAELMKKLAGKSVHGENLVQKMLGGE